MNATAPTFTTSEAILVTLASCAWVASLLQVLLVDVAGEQVRRRDRHDRRRDQRADADGGERDAGEPGRELLVEQQRHDRVAVHAAGVAPGSGFTPAAMAM